MKVVTPETRIGYTLLGARGPIRRPKAARRLVFELNWRLAGDRTYRAAGVAKQMFCEGD